MRYVVCNDDQVRALFNIVTWTEGEIALFRLYSISCDVRNLSELTFLIMRAMRGDDKTRSNFTSNGDITSFIKKSDLIIDYLVFLMETSDDDRIGQINYQDFYNRMSWYVKEIMNTFETIIGNYDRNIEFHLGEGGIVCTQV